MYFDTHAHYCDRQFDDDRYTLLDSMTDSEVSLILNAGSSLNRSKFSVELAEKYPFMFASVGIHPHAASKMTDNSITELEMLLAHPKAVAVGEIGLDYHYDYSPRDVQRKRFREQLELARQLGKPVIVHEREALNDTLEIVRDFQELSMVFHCFSGSWDTARTILDMGFCLSFTGVITFKNARRVIEVLEKMPLDRMMLETDCPYMAPEPMRGRRCTSLMLPHIAEKIAQIRGVSTEEVAAATYETGKRFFDVE